LKTSPGAGSSIPQNALPTMTEKTASPLHGGETAKFFFTVMQAAKQKIFFPQWGLP
jgi:hypothetical protein